MAASAHDMRLLEEIVDDPGVPAAPSSVDIHIHLGVNSVPLEMENFQRVVNNLSGETPRRTINLHLHFNLSTVPDNVNGTSRNEDCGICFESTADVKLPCGHKFCERCIRPWLIMKKKCGMSWCNVAARTSDMTKL